jgi:hypothetical protein
MADASPIIQRLAFHHLGSWLGNLEQKQPIPAPTSDPANSLGPCRLTSS